MGLFGRLAIGHILDDEETVKVGFVRAIFERADPSLLVKKS